MRVVAFILPLACFSLGARAADIEARSTIVSVLVHPDAATATREARVDLPAGASTILFRNLPASLDPASLRVSGEGEARALIGAVETRGAAAAVTPPDTAVETRLKALRGEREAIQATLDALGVKQAMIQRYSQASPEKLGPDGKATPVAEWGAAFTAIGTAYASVAEELRRVRARAQEIDEEIRALAGGRGRAATRGPARDVLVSVEAASAGSARIALTYLTQGAGWTPAYEARLDTGEKERKPSLTLVRRALVAQRTGEDWSNVQLSVSTVRAERGASAPEPQTQRLALAEPPYAAAASEGRLAKAAPRMRGLDAAAPPPAMAPAAPISEEAPKPEPLREQAATLDAGAYQATFRVAGLVSAPGDGSPKSFTLSARQLEPKLTVRTAPALDPTAYLEARIVNDEEAPLLPGQISVQRDGAFVGVSALALTPSGDSVELGFGVDDRVKVTRAPVKKQENEPGWFGQTKTDLRDFKTVIKNLHPFPVRMTAVDQIPVSENSAIIVETLPQTTPPSEKQLGERRGVMGWSFDLPAGETKEIRLAYRVKWPADRELVTLGGRVGAP
jgi:uncharacterized protein (TIGR02231 family)